MSNRTQRISNGELPNYGRQHVDPLQETAHWRARLKNERTGSHKTVRASRRWAHAVLDTGPTAPVSLCSQDYSGTNTSLSMVWDVPSDAVRAPACGAKGTRAPNASCSCGHTPYQGHKGTLPAPRAPTPTRAFGPLQSGRGVALRTSKLHMQNDFGTHTGTAGANAQASNREIESHRAVPGSRQSSLQHYARAGAHRPVALARLSHLRF